MSDRKKVEVIDSVFLYTVTMMMKTYFFIFNGEKVKKVSKNRVWLKLWQIFNEAEEKPKVSENQIKIILHLHSRRIKMRPMPSLER